MNQEAFNELFKSLKRDVKFRRDAVADKLSGLRQKVKELDKVDQYSAPRVVEAVHEASEAYLKEQEAYWNYYLATRQALQTTAEKSKLKFWSGEL